MVSANPVNQRPATLATSINECDETRFPNLFKLLKIGCTLPVHHVSAREASLV